MKKLNLFLIVLLAATITFVSSCKNEEDPEKPNVVVTVSAPDGYVKGAIVVYSLNVSSNADLKTIAVSAGAVTPSTGSAFATSTKLESSTATSATFAKSTTSAQLEYSFVIPATLGEGTKIVVSFTVVDKDASATIDAPEFTVAPVAPTKTVKTLAPKTLGGQSSSSNSFASLTGPDSYKLSETGANASKFDIVFYRHSTYKSTLALEYAIASPDYTDLVNLYSTSPYTATGKNTTKLAKVTATIDWANLDAATIETEAAKATDTTKKIRPIATGDYVAFVTKGGVKGIMKVGALTGSDTDVTAVLDVKIVEEAAATAK
jgi:hypothetical protein